MSLTVVCCLSCDLVCALGTVECWGGDREDVALSYVYADSGCVAGRKVKNSHIPV